MDFSFRGIGFANNILKSSIVIVCFLNVCGLAVASDGCLHQSVFVSEHNNDFCPRIYYRCERSNWNKALCVGGYFNTTLAECVPFSENCVNIADPTVSPGVTRAVRHQSSSGDSIANKNLPPVRTKRQTTQEDDCDNSYHCPASVTQEFIYPDWANKDCDTYYMCLRGVLDKKSCKDGVFKYYNPRTFSCEEKASPTNTCLNRAFTDLSPLQQVV